MRHLHGSKSSRSECIQPKQRRALRIALEMQWDEIIPRAAAARFAAARPERRPAGILSYRAEDVNDVVVNLC